MLSPIVKKCALKTATPYKVLCASAIHLQVPENNTTPQLGTGKQTAQK